MKGKSTSDQVPASGIPTDQFKEDPSRVRVEFTTPQLRGSAPDKLPTRKPKPALTKEQRRARRKKRFKIFMAALYILIGIAIGFVAGRAWPDRTEISFYARVVEVAEAHILVDGIEENDINHRGQKYVSLDKLDTEMKAQTLNGEDLDVADLEVGDLLRITYDGTSQEVFPPRLPNVWKIEKTEPLS